MFRKDLKGGAAPARPALAHALRTGMTLACLASALGPQGWAHAEDRHATRTAQAAPVHDPSAHGDATRAPAGVPPALPEPMAAPTTIATTPAPAAGLGLADFERLALERNPTLRQAFAQLDAARSRSFQAGLYPNPVIGYTAEQIGVPSEVAAEGTFGRNRTPGELQGGFVQQEIVTGGKLRLSRAKFAEEANTARWQAEAQRFRVLNGVRVAYFEVAADQGTIELERQLVAINEDAVRTTEELVNVGQANEPDLLQARVEAHRARVALRNAENRYRADWEMLVALAGAPELRPLPLDMRPLEAEAAPLDFDAVLADLLHRSPEIQAALAEIRRDQIMVRRERAEPIPNITIQGVTGYNYEFGITTAGVQASIPLPVWNRNQGTVREAMADLSRARAEYERVGLSIRQRLADAYNRYEDARQSVEDYRAETLPLARRAFEVQSENFRQRRAAWPQVLVARRTLVDLQLDYTMSLLELRRAEVEIAGMLLVDGLTPPAGPTPQGHIEATPQPR
ncbi:TolC family protein [Tautonia sociabilis]|uniref:TolC family protein n=1 Tax=Tautonia sociabilis TaxID=2080755 RepID=A0A432MI58_9BACT|nr:TolC family protein [Tautonia sociabilis]RUL87029.1 TolC family protein [Tautonia sociabilis]